jgi:hypothetical protein
VRSGCYCTYETIFIFLERHYFNALPPNYLNYQQIEGIVKAHDIHQGDTANK